MSEKEEYENTIRRLKVLSKTQTAFLKSYLHSKLTAGSNLVNKTIECLNKIDNNPSIQSTIKELKTALTALKLNEVEVDVNSAQLMLR